MAEVPGRAGPTSPTARRRLTGHMTAVRARRPWVDHLARSVERYHHGTVEYFALKVVSRGLFLAVSTMLVFLFVFQETTSLMPGINEIAIPTVTLPDSTDLGAIVHATYERTRGAVLDVLGVLTLVLSAVLTAKAVRRGTARVLDPEKARSVRMLQPLNLVAGLAIAVIVLVTWLLVFTTSIRSAAIKTLVGGYVSEPVINVGKALAVVAAWALVSGVVFVLVRRYSRDRPAAPAAFACAVYGVVVVGANYFLLYSYVAAIVDPDASGGVILVLTLLAWVNVVSRGLFLMECWIAECGVPTVVAEDGTAPLAH